MATLTVGAGQEYTTIAAAVDASGTGDTINVEAGTYTNDFVTITHDLTLNAVGGTVTMVATEQPPDGKAIIDEGGSGVNVTITGFDMSGATVPDGNGAAIRYEGGSLTLNDDTIHDNQEGLLAADDPNGTITINGSTFSDNGSGTGYTHNIYVGDIASLTVENSTITGAVGGHDIKSRAENTTITNNTITDGTSGTASYEIDLPNGGNATVTGNVVEKGANATNPIAISYGEEGGVYASSSLTVQGNTMLNDDASQNTTAVVNDASITATIDENTLYGWTAVSSGAATATSNTSLTTEPSLSSLTPGDTSTTSTTDPSSGTTTSSSDTGTSSTTSTSTTDAGNSSSASGTVASTGTSGDSSLASALTDPANQPYSGTAASPTSSQTSTSAAGATNTDHAYSDPGGYHTYQSSQHTAHQFLTRNG